MTLAPDILQKLRREEFPVTQQKAWFNTATYGPLPTSNVEAQTRLLQEMSQGQSPPGLGHWWEGAAGVRDRVGGFLGCKPEDVALLHSTGEGLGLVALGLDWRPGDEVVVYDNEFPSGVYPFLALGKRGVKVRFIEDRGRHRFDIDDVEAVMTSRTRVVSISLVNCYHGFRAPVEQMARLCHDRGCLLLCDAVQATGALVVDVPSLGADLLSAHGYKSLCSGYGISLCYVSPELRDMLEVISPGWKSVENAPFIGKQLDYNLDYAGDARRYEASVQNLAGMYGLGASIDLFTSAGMQLINDWVLGISRTLLEELDRVGYRVASSTSADEMSGIISVEVPDADAQRVCSLLAERGVMTAVRDGRLRVSSHLFNDHSDIDRLVEALPAVR